MVAVGRIILAVTHEFIPTIAIHVMVRSDEHGQRIELKQICLVADQAQDAFLSTSLPTQKRFYSPTGNRTGDWQCSEIRHEVQLLVFVNDAFCTFDF